ncbi:MAG: DUF1571 domain-containing protein [Bacteroidia bacterium]
MLILRIIVSFLLILIADQELAAQNAISIVRNMFTAAHKVETLQYTMAKKERIDGKMVSQVSTTKMQSEPLKVYIRQQSPEEGLEVLYVTGKNNGKALINPNGFPWINVSLDPLGGQMRKDQHHTIFQSGFGYFIAILENLMKKYEDDLPRLVVYKGEAEVDGVACHRILFDNPNFGYRKYTIQPGESLKDIARKFHIGEYQILEANADLYDFDDGEPGMEITIPVDYARKMEIFINKQSRLPVLLRVYDDKGLYEEYRYHNVKVNPPFREDEFTENYPDYGF